MTSSPSMGSLGLSCDSLGSEGPSDHPRPQPSQSPKLERVPLEVIPNDHLLCGLDVDSLTLTDKTWIQEQSLDFYSKSVHATMAAKFTRFARFYDYHELPDH